MKANNERQMDVFFKEAVFTLPRLLSLINQNEASSLYGCFDRTYWNYKMIDFPCGRMQESCLSLALLAKEPYDGINPYYGNSKLTKLAKGSTLFLARIQKSDGTFDQFWPNEVSSAGSAFPAYCLAASYELIADELSTGEKSEVVESLHRSLKLCISLAETDYGFKGALNQEIGTICALSKIAKILGSSTVQEIIQSRLDNFLSFQTSEGWFPEFEGADAGYSFVTLDYLMKIYQILKRDDILEAAEGLIGFLAYIIHPNGTLGGEYMSRNTEWIAPHGLAILSQYSQTAMSVLKYIMRGLDNGNLMGLRYLDDRYLTYEHYTYLQAALLADRTDTNVLHLPFEQEQNTVLKKAGIVSITKGDYYILFSPRKGGNFRLYNRHSGKLIVSDTGLVITNQSGNSLITGWLQNIDDVKYSLEDENEALLLHSRSNIKKYSDTVPSPIFMVLSRIGLKAISLSFKLRRKLLEFLRNMLITKKPKIVGVFQRRLELQDHSLLVRDYVELEEGTPKSLTFSNRATSRYITSKQFGQFQDLSSIRPARTQISRTDNGFSSVRHFDLNEKTISPGFELRYI